ncbi:Protein tyrosine and serine/threonine kinase [Pelomyxa schiedti]|nr:Protein tyrosine and serine/threonine kinase [Pelomyxa schiedti]
MSASPSTGAPAAKRKNKKNKRKDKPQQGGETSLSAAVASTATPASASAPTAVPTPPSSAAAATTTTTTATSASAKAPCLLGNETTGPLARVSKHVSWASLSPCGGPAVGTGFSGSAAKMILNGQNVVVKQVPMKNSRLKEEFARELDVYETCWSYSAKPPPHVCEYYGAGICPAKMGNPDTGFIVLGLYDSDAWSEIKSQPPRTKTAKAPTRYLHACHCVAKAMEYLHSIGFLYRDLHLGNVLLRGKGDKPEVALCDFGAALQVTAPAISFSGHRRLIGPEVAIQRLNNEPLTNYGKASDVYMFGAMLFEVLEGFVNNQRFFHDMGPDDDVMRAVVQGRRPTISALMRENNPKLVSLIQACWDQNTHSRPPFSDILGKMSEIVENGSQSPKKPVFQSAPPMTDIPFHTKNLYMPDEVMSCLQKCIRRSEVDNLLFWIAELDQSKMGRAAIDRLSVIMSEDVSISVLLLPCVVTKLREEYIHAAGQKNGPLSKKLLMQCAEVLARSPKCRMANNACCATMGYVKKGIAANDPLCTTHWEVSMNEVSRGECPAFCQLRQLLHEAVDDISAEDRALMLLQRLYMGDMENPTGWIDKIWNFIFTLDFPSELKCYTDKVYNSLFSIRSVGGEGGERLRIFHCILLYTRQKTLLKYSQIDPPSPEITPEKIENIYNCTTRLPVPDYCVDRHTFRGKGGGSDANFCYGGDTNGYLGAAAKSLNIDISHWDAAERAKSHGPGVKSKKNISVKSSVAAGLPTLIEWFFDVGSAVPEGMEIIPYHIQQVTSASFRPEGDHRRPQAKEFYLKEEEEFGSVQAKSVKIMDKHRALLKAAFAQRAKPVCVSPTTSTTSTTTTKGKGKGKGKKS